MTNHYPKLKLEKVSTKCLKALLNSKLINVDRNKIVKILANR